MYFSHVGLVGDLINLALTHLITFFKFLVVASHHVCKTPFCVCNILFRNIVFVVETYHGLRVFYKCGHVLKLLSTQTELSNLPCYIQKKS